MTPDEAGLEALEIELLLEGGFRRYGYDFRGYAQASRRRRILRQVDVEGVGSVSALLEKVLHDRECWERLLSALTIQVTEMFRDPAFFRALRAKVLPGLLARSPVARIWVAGCSTGEEVYSLAIVLAEERFLDRVRIYATDIKSSALERARERVFPLERMKEYSASYLAAGGRGSLADHYVAAYGSALFATSLSDGIVFAEHNLATDGSFNEFDLILCRNVMIYFDRPLHERVFKLLHESLRIAGVLGLGDKESISPSPFRDCYERADQHKQLFTRVR